MRGRWGWWSPQAYLVVGVVVLLLQDRQTALALVAGAIAMFGVYAYQQRGRAWLKTLKAWWRSPQRPLVVSVLAGAVAMVVTEMIMGVWLSVPNHWLAGAVTLQLLVSLGILWLLLRQAWQGWVGPDPLAGVVEQLLSEDVSDRLLGLQKLAKHLEQDAPKELPPAQQKLMIDLCQAVMERETVPVVQKAAQHTLQLLQSQ